MAGDMDVGYYDESSFGLYRVRDVYEDVLGFLRDALLRSPYPEYRRAEIRFDDGEAEYDGLSSGLTLLLGVLGKQTQYVYGDGGTFYPESVVVRFSLRCFVSYPAGITESRLAMFDVMDYVERCLSLYQDEERGRRLLMTSSSDAMGRFAGRSGSGSEITLSSQMTFDVQWDYIR